MTAESARRTVANKFAISYPNVVDAQCTAPNDRKQHKFMQPLSLI